MTLVTIINKNLETLIPLIHEFNTQIKKHIIFYDRATMESRYAHKLHYALKKLSNKQKIELIEVDEDSRSDISHLQKILANQKAPLYLNATDADLSLVTILSGYILQNSGFVFAYDKYDNSYNKISKESFSNHQITHNLTLDLFSLYMGYKKRTRDVASIEKYRPQVNYLFKNSYSFFKNEFLLKKGRINQLDKTFKSTLIALKMLDKNLQYTRKKSFGELFEYFIFLKLQQYDFDDIEMGVEIVFDEALEIVNEFDILAMKNNHVYVIECKLGTASESNEVIYKLDSLIENFGEDSRGLIVNLQTDMDRYKNDLFLNKKFSQRAYKRAKFNNLEIYNDYLFNEFAFDEIMRRCFLVNLKSEKQLSNEPLFLLGGRDLEMLEIQKMLITHKKHFINKKLSWGAKLSAYINLLNDTVTYYGIELVEDVTPPKNYVAIDHHNEAQEKKSSIEQVAEILGIELNRYQTLVALNDKGYISAMERFGATEVEIALIRQKDREAQGVTEEDEILAEVSFLDASSHNGIYTIKAQTDKFSPIIDRCYKKYENVLIYNDKKFVYHGRGVEQLVKNYRNEIRKKKLYYGGDYGFFGVNEKAYPPHELQSLQKEVVKSIVDTIKVF